MPKTKQSPFRDASAALAAGNLQVLYALGASRDDICAGLIDTAVATLLTKHDARDVAATLYGMADKLATAKAKQK